MQHGKIIISDLNLHASLLPSSEMVTRQRLLNKNMTKIPLTKPSTPNHPKVIILQSKILDQRGRFWPRRLFLTNRGYGVGHKTSHLNLG